MAAFSRSKLVLLLSLLACSWPVATRADDKEVDVHQLKQEFFPGRATTFETDLSIGDLVIEGADQRNIEVDLHFFCLRDNLDACRSVARKVYLTSRTHRNTIEVELQRTPRARVQGIRAEMRVRVPRQMAVEVDVRSGSVTVSKMLSDVEIDAAAGVVEITHERNLVGQVKIDVGIGAAHLWVDGGEIKGSGFPRSVNWKGQGNARLEVDLGTGDVDVKLR